jgi:hypothetical protein
MLSRLLHSGERQLWARLLPDLTQRIIDRLQCATTGRSVNQGYTSWEWTKQPLARAGRASLACPTTDDWGRASAVKGNPMRAFGWDSRIVYFPSRQHWLPRESHGISLGALSRPPVGPGISVGEHWLSRGRSFPVQGEYFPDEHMIGKSHPGSVDFRTSFECSQIDSVEPT